MFIAGLFIIAQSEKSPKCSSADTWVNITWYIPTREHYLPIQSKDVLMHDMEQPWNHWTLETIMLNYRRLHIIWSYWYEMSRVTQSWLVIHRNEGGNGKPLQCSCLGNLMDRILLAYRPWCYKESDTTEWVTLSLSLSHTHTQVKEGDVGEWVMCTRFIFEVMNCFKVNI